MGDCRLGRWLVDWRETSCGLVRIDGNLVWGLVLFDISTRRLGMRDLGLILHVEMNALLEMLLKPMDWESFLNFIDVWNNRIGRL